MTSNDHCLSQLKSCSGRINCNHLWHGCINTSWLQSLDLSKISPNLVENSLAPAKISPYLVGISPNLVKNSLAPAEISPYLLACNVEQQIGERRRVFQWLFS
nr:hypothetical protein CFP56_59570 [Quercus suber]